MKRKYTITTIIEITNQSSKFSYTVDMCNRKKTKHFNNYSIVKFLNSQIKYPISFNFTMLADPKGISLINARMNLLDDQYYL